MQLTDKAHIEDRLDDLRIRVVELFNQIHSWLANSIEFRVERSKPVSIDGEKIGKYGVDKIQLPTANIYRSNKLIASLKPKGLWVIGANVRVDLISNSRLITLYDTSEPKENSNWEINYSKNRQEKLPLTQSNFIKVLNSL